VYVSHGGLTDVHRGSVMQANLRQQIADQLPKGGLMTQPDGQKVQVNVHLNVLIKHQGKEVRNQSALVRNGQGFSF